MNINYEEASKLFYYEDSMLKWKINGKRHKVGDVVGSCKGKYCRVKIEGKSYYIHRLVYLLHYKKLEKSAIIHKDGNPHNNDIKNLQLYSPPNIEKVDQDALLEMFLYDEDRGVLINRQYRAGGKVKKGTDAANPHHTGYRYVLIKNKNYAEHRLVYMYHHGSIPKNLVIDHIDGNPSNNRIENLRLATLSQNQYNRKNLSTSKCKKGVSYHTTTGKYVSAITVDTHKIYLGLYLTEEEAHEAYKVASSKYHKEFGRVE